MTHSVYYEEAFTQATARRHAIWKLVNENEQLRTEFQQTYPFVFDRDKFTQNIEKFISDKGITIIEETPIVEVTKEGNYRVDVLFTIDIPDENDDTMTV